MSVGQVASDVLQNCIGVVDVRRSHSRVGSHFCRSRGLRDTLLLGGVGWRQSVRGHVETAEREVNYRVDFAGDAAVVVVAEAL